MSKVRIVAPHQNQSEVVSSFEEIMNTAIFMYEFLDKSAPHNVALHHSQVCTKNPKNFFIIRRSAMPIDKKWDGVICNGKILEKDAKSKRTLTEGCMSYPFRPVKKVIRYERVKVAYDHPEENLNIPGTFKFVHREHWITGFVAQIFQHEIDHGHGKLLY